MIRLFVSLGVFLSLVSCSRKIVEEDKYVQLIPTPIEVSLEDNYFNIKHTTTLAFPAELQNEGSYLKELIESSSVFELTQMNDGIIARKNIIIIEIDTTAEYTEGYEGYLLEIFPKYINIKGKNPQSVMRGIQTLRQLFPIDFHDPNVKKREWNIPCQIIKDAAKFEHRGMLLDCCRHFFDKEVVKKYIDLLALYKMNVLHWHLTEDQAWRIEIDKYPLLTEIGSKRTELDSTEYSGYYTKSDIKEIVAYANERHIQVIPEIEMPGHSQAAIASYPNLSCTGQQIEVANDWGVFKDIYCAGNDSTFIFLENVLNEVIELFPSEYIHIGGDEAPKTRWEKCEKCQKRIQTEDLQNEHDLQSYFISRIDSFLTSKGKKLIGWDEILEGGLSPNATVQSWRGMDGGIHAANEGHDVIMSPTSHCYFDYDLGSIDLKKVYSFDPIPEGLPLDKKQHILGAECNLWSEHIPNEQNLDSKVFPRIFGISEVLWSYPGERNYSEFYNRVLSQYPLLKNLNVKYGFAAIPLTLRSINENGTPSIQAELNIPNTKLNYRWICSGCDPELYEYTEPIEITKDGTIEYYVMKDGKVFGDTFREKYVKHLGANAKIEYHSDYSSSYTAGGAKGLQDGRTGTNDFRDGKWQGTQGEFWVDYSFDTDIYCHSVRANFYQYNNAWIFLPTEFEVWATVDGKNWNSLGISTPQKAPELRGEFIETFSVEFDGTDIKGLRIKAKNIGKVPDWHEAAGSDAWIFIDEIIIE